MNTVIVENTPARAVLTHTMNNGDVITETRTSSPKRGHINSTYKLNGKRIAKLDAENIMDTTEETAAPTEDETPETKTVYIGKGRYGTNHKGHAIATHTPAPRPNHVGPYVYTVTITDLDGTETTLPEPVENIHAEAVAVKAWEARNAAPAEATKIELGTRVEIIGGPRHNISVTGTVTSRYSIRHGHMMNDITTDWGNVINYFADSQLKALAPKK